MAVAVIHDHDLSSRQHQVVEQQNYVDGEARPSGRG